MGTRVGQSASHPAQPAQASSASTASGRSAKEREYVLNAAWSPSARTAGVACARSHPVSHSPQAMQADAAPAIARSSGRVGTSPSET